MLIDTYIEKTSTNTDVAWDELYYEKNLEHK